MFGKRIQPVQPEDPFVRYKLLVNYIRKHESVREIPPEKALFILMGEERTDVVYYECLQHSLAVLAMTRTPPSRTEIAQAIQRIKGRLGAAYPDMLEDYERREPKIPPKEVGS